MDSLEEIKLLRKQYQFTLNEYNQKKYSADFSLDEFIFINLMNIKKPYTDLINLMGDIRQQINEKCSDFKIKELGIRLDQEFNLLQKAKEGKDNLEYRVFRYNELKSEYSRVICLRKELQCKYTYLKKILPKVERTLLKFEREIMSLNEM